MTSDPRSAVPEVGLPTVRLRIVLGLGADESDAGLIAETLALRFAEPFVTLCHVVADPGESGRPLEEGGLDAARWVREQERDGVQALRSGLDQIDASLVRGERHLDFGDPATELKSLAERDGADLVAVAHRRRGRLDDLVLGSTARRLLHTLPRHLLVLRPLPPVLDRGIAVIASDDSESGSRAVDELLRLAPKGLRRIHVLTVDRGGCETAARLAGSMPDLESRAAGWFALGLKKDAERLCERLRMAGYVSDPVVVSGDDLVQTMGGACDALSAGLLVVASRPHGFWDRFFNGSVSERLLNEDPRSLLVLRV